MDQSANDLFAPDTTPPPSATGWALCEFSSLAFLLPQQDLAGIEQAHELTVALPGETAMGWFASPQGPWPVYAINQQLQSFHIGAKGNFIVFVHAAPQPIGLLCESIRIIGQQQALKTLPVPAPLCHSSLFASVTAIARLSSQRLAYVVECGQTESFMSQLIQNSRSLGRHVA
jgi:hypothetical protein